VELGICDGTNMCPVNNVGGGGAYGIKFSAIEFLFWFPLMLVGYAVLNTSLVIPLVRLYLGQYVSIIGI